MKITCAEKCAWRAIYISRNDWCNSPIARLGIDPTADNPSVFGAIYLFPYNPNNRGKYDTFTKVVWMLRRITDWEFRIRIPFMQWHYKQSEWRQTWQNWIHQLDGRFQR